jgi:hypothetical protein
MRELAVYIPPPRLFSQAREGYILCSHVRVHFPALASSFANGFCLSLCRFEKSLYDLIRGLRNHKGNEAEYIQNSLKECRTEIKSQDMGASLHARHLLLFAGVCWELKRLIDDPAPTQTRRRRPF